MTYYKLKKDIEDIIEKGGTKTQLKRRINKRLKDSIINYFGYLRNFHNNGMVTNAKRFFGFEWEK